MSDVEIYLDNSATTRPLDEANQAYLTAAQECYGNPSSLHRKGFEAELLVESAKAAAADTFCCKTDEIIFTSGATESNNLALKGAAEAYPRRGTKIVTTEIEHPSVLETLSALEKRGYEIIRLAPNEKGEYTKEMFYNATDENTVLVSCMWVNNETGLILPVIDIAKAIKEKNPETIFHVDGVQGFLKLPLKLSSAQIDLFSVSGHKVCAPKGIGALYVKKGIRLIPQLHGGGQQDNIRSGTEPVPAIAAFGAAVRAQKDKIADNLKKYSKLKEVLINSLCSCEWIKINSAADSAPYIISLAVKGIRSEIMLHFLEERKIYVSSGSACKKGKQSHVLKALGMSKELSDETIRISFGTETDEKAVEELVNGLKDGYSTLARKR